MLIWLETPVLCNIRFLWKAVPVGGIYVNIMLRSRQVFEPVSHDFKPQLTTL